MSDDCCENHCCKSNESHHHHHCDDDYECDKGLEILVRAILSLPWWLSIPLMCAFVYALIYCWTLAN